MDSWEFWSEKNLNVTSSKSNIFLGAQFLRQRCSTEFRVNTRDLGLGNVNISQSLLGFYGRNNETSHKLYTNESSVMLF